MGIRKHIGYIALFWCLSLAQAGIAQAQKYHRVQAGETKYGISRQYGVSIEALVKANPEIADGLKAGKQLRIPEVQENSVNTSAAPDSNERFHLVKEGETLYGIARQYKVSISAIKQANPGLADQLKVDQKIILPAAAQTKKEGGSQRYYQHQVAEGETLAALSRWYDLPMDSVFLLNPAVEKGLVIGQSLKIPMANYRQTWTERHSGSKQDSLSDTSRTSSQQKPAVAGEDPYILHRVKTGDTFYSLQEDFNVSREELLRINPELEKGLKPDRYILIPKVPEKPTTWLDRLLRKVEEDGSEDGTLQKQLRDSLNAPSVEQVTEPLVNLDTVSVDLDRRLRIALMLPFNAGAQYDTTGKANLDLSAGSRMSLEFYQGFVMAVDSLTKMGAGIRLDVFDTRQNQFRVKRLMDSLQNQAYDLIVGPAFKENVEFVARRTAASSIPVISPLSRRVDPTISPNLIQVVPDQAAYHRQLARILDQEFPRSQVVFIHSGALSEMEKIHEVISYLQPRRKGGFIENVVVSEEALSSSEQWGARWPDSTVKAAVVISDDPVYITDAVSRLKALGDTDLFLVGGARLLNMPSLEKEYLDALKLTMAEVRYVNWEDQELQDFLRRYRQRYYGDPSEFALQAFDIGWYFVPRLWRSGPYFKESLAGQTWEGLSTGFEMELLPQGGLKNTFLFTTGVRGFALERLKPQAVEKVPAEPAERQLPRDEARD